jgi:transcriptional regulator with XRE-family HTH domain
MPHVPSSEITGLVVRMRMALGLTQKELGERFGASMRTAARWEGGNSQPSLEQIQEMARAVHEKDAALAAALAAESGTTLEGLGLVTRARTEPLVPAGPPPRPFPPIALMVDSVVLAALDAVAAHAETPLRERAAIIDVLGASVGRAKGLGLTIDELDGALAGLVQRMAAAKK